MRTMQFNDRMQYSFWGNVEYPTNKLAMQARNALAKDLKAKGFTVTKSSLTGQMRKYASLGQPDGTIGTVYYLNAMSKLT